MTRDDIIKLAMRAGIAPLMTNKPVMYPSPDAIERFATLVAAREREACAKWFERRSDQPFYGRHVAAAIRERGGQ